jgi:multidrug resistance efflux pump
MCRTISFDEGPQQDIGVAWNYSGADMWAAWVDLNSASAALADAEQRLDDLLQLRSDPQEAKVKVAQAEAAYQTALAEVDVAQARLETLKAQPRAEQVALAETQVKQAEADLAGLKVQLDKHVLEAPRSGQVVARAVHEGEMATPGAAMLTVADLSQLTLTVYVPAPDVSLVSIGQEVSVYVDAFPGEPFTGHVTFIGEKAEFTPKNVQTKEERVNTVFAVKIQLENPDQRLKPGMPADVILAAEPQL